MKNSGTAKFDCYNRILIEGYSRKIGVALKEGRGGVLIFWQLFWFRFKTIFSKINLKLVFSITC